MLQVISVFIECLEIADVADALPEGGDGAGPDAAEVGFEFCKDHFDWVEIGAVGRKEKEPCSAFLWDGLWPFRFCGWIDWRV